MKIITAATNSNSIMIMVKIMIYIALFFAVISCGRDKTIKDNTVIRENSKHIPNDTSSLQYVDLNDKKYGDARSYIKDTITKQGWTIQYLVKNDSTKYSDLYIRISKADLRSVFVAKDALEYRRYFIPTYESENGSNIFFTHGCATDCRAILCFSKSTNKFIDYLNVVDYNLKLGQILYVDESSYEDEQKIYNLILVDATRKKAHKVSYNDICMPVYKPGCIDTVIFALDKVIIKTVLTEKVYRNNDVLQTKIISLK